MSEESRLAQLQENLKQRGVRDVKFFFGNTWEKPVSKLAADAADALEAFANGHYTEFDSLTGSVPS